MSGRALLLIVAGVIFISGNIFLQLTDRAKDITANVDRTYLRETANNISESGVGIGMRKIADDRTWRAGIPLMDLFGGKATITAVDTTYIGKPAIMVTCIGIANYGHTGEYRDTSIAFVYGDTIPGVIQGTVTTTHEVDEDAGFEVDGRDHDDHGTLTGDQGCGKKAVWTEGGCTQKSPGKVAGSDGDHDANSASDPNVVAQHQTCAGGFPHSPDSIMSTCGVHFAEGTLKSAAQSGAHGCQYTTNPATLTYPLKGVTYVELPAGGAWSGANVTGSGVLVVHNATNDSHIKNLSAGPFTGIVIADEVDHVNCSVIGAIVSIGCHPDTIASGSGKIVFSRKTVKDATESAVQSVTNGSRESAIAWKQ